MSEATAIRKTRRSMLPFFRQTTGDRDHMTATCAGTLGLAPHRRPSALMEARSVPELRVVGDDKADQGIISQLLFIGDDPALTPEQLRLAFPAPACRVQTAGTGNNWLDQCQSKSPDVIVLDLGLRDESGLEVYQQIRRINARIPVIFVTDTKRADATIEAIKHGAYDCLFKPVDMLQLRRVVGEALNVARRMSQPAAAGEETTTKADTEDVMVGCCTAMREVYKAIGRVAAQDVPVLITGESGTGKELVARAIHQHGQRAHTPFLALNCAAIPENLLESELFGHEKSAFTGADRRRIGKFEQCHGGTLFLDEIGDMPLSLQSKVLRLVQEQAFERVGGNETIRTDVRLIAATHRDLKAWSAEGKFRADLYYRLGVFTIHLPTLREREDDIPLLVQHYLRRFSRELDREVRHVDPDALDRLRRHNWPGNIRELQSVLKQALLQASGAILLPEFLPDYLSGVCNIESAAAAGDDPGMESVVLGQRLGTNVRNLYADTHHQVNRLLLPRVLEHTGGNIQQAALVLGIARQTLRLKLRELGLSVARPVDVEEDEKLQ
jgi:DNA-binding NtrC family response regulator